MERRKALAQRNRRPQVSSNVQEQPQHAVDAQKQNGFINKGNGQTWSSSPSSALEGGNNATGLTLPKGDCTLCRKPAICVCQRCGDYYCSPECQRKDWSSHRYICFPIPALVYPSTTLSTDALFAVDTPMLTVNQAQLKNASLGNRQPALFETLNASNFPPQYQQNNQQQNHVMNGLILPQPQQQHQQQQLQRFGQNFNKSSPSNANKVQKYKEPTATIPKAELPKTNSRVILTGLRTPNRGYIRALTPAEDEDYLLNARKIDSYGKKAPALDKIPKTNSYAIAAYDGVMYRVEVMAVRNPDNIRVLFVDRGIVASRRLSELRQITDEIISLKQHTCLIPLRNVSNYVLNEKLVKHFATYEDLEFKIKYDQVDDGVDLLYWQTEKSLNDEIEQFCKDAGAKVWADTMRLKQEETGKKGRQVDKHTKDGKTNAKDSKITKSVDENESVGGEHDDQFYAISESTRNSTVNSYVTVKQQQPRQKKENEDKKEKDENTVNNIEEVERPTMIAPFETHFFKVGCPPFKAIVLDVSCLEIGYIGCIAQTDCACLQNVHKQLCSITLPDKPYEPRMDEYCIAKFEDMWYRAQVTDIKGKVYTVMYIDFTNEANLTSADIRHYPPEVTGVCKTNLCLIDGLPSNFSNELIQFLNDEIKLQTEITIDAVIKIDEQVVVIECKSLLDKIRNKNLLT